MTLVLAMQVDGGFIMCADTQVTEELLRTRGAKLHEHESLPIAWGYSGEMPLGEEFSGWLASFDPKGLTWEQLRDEGREVVTKLRRKQRDLIRQADGRPSKSDNIDVIVAGYINKIPNILVLYGTGEFSFKGADQYFAIGSGGTFARLALLTLRHWHKDIRQQELPYDAQLAQFVTAIGSEYDLYSSPPLKNIVIRLVDIDESGRRIKET